MHPQVRKLMAYLWGYRPAVLRLDAQETLNKSKDE
jgi:hypothetical protein